MSHGRIGSLKQDLDAIEWRNSCLGNAACNAACEQRSSHVLPAADGDGRQKRAGRSGSSSSSSMGGCCMRCCDGCHRCCCLMCHCCACTRARLRTERHGRGGGRQRERRSLRKRRRSGSVASLRWSASSVVQASVGWPSGSSGRCSPQRVAAGESGCAWLIGMARGSGGPCGSSSAAKPATSVLLGKRAIGSIIPQIKRIQ